MAPKFPGFQELKIDENYPCKINNIKREEFVRILGSTYVDHAASTLYSEKQLDDIFSSFKSLLLSNPHSRHLPSDLTTEAIESIRNRVLYHFNTNSSEYELIFTSGATDAIKLVANYFVWNSSKISSRSIFAYLGENHTSVIGLREPARAKGVTNFYSLTSDEIEGCFKISKNVNNYIDNSGAKHSFDNCLFAYPAQSNFSGTKYPLSWIDKVHKGLLTLDGEHSDSDPHSISNKELKSDRDVSRVWYVLLDAAGLVGTSPLDLSQCKPDFVPISFYKMFGYPTGLGCLLVSKRAWHCLHKPYFGGGTVLIADSLSLQFRRRPTLHEQFEDGTVPFLDILSLQQGFNTLFRIIGRMENSEEHVFNLSRYLIYNLRSMKHENGQPVAEVYSVPGRLTLHNHGSIVNFNLKYSNGEYIGYSHVEKVASLSNIYLRTGCVCNPGGCQKYLKISSEKLMEQFKAGHVCGDLNDLVDGWPTGSVRVSFGYMSTYEDADAVLNMIKECFVDGELLFVTSWQDTDEYVNGDVETEIIYNGLESSSLNGITCDLQPYSESSEESGPSKEIPTEIEYSKPDLTLTQIEQVVYNSSKTLKSNVLLTDIIVYPVKSCAGISISRWPIGPLGLKYDRQWAIVTSSGVTLTMKRNTRLSLVKPWIDEEQNTLTLSYEGFESINVNLKPTTNEKPISESNYCSGRVCGDKINGVDCGDQVGSWLSSVFGTSGLRLVQQIQARKCKLVKNEIEAKKELSLANESQYVAIHRPSIRQLAQQMTANGHQIPVPSEEELKLRFRPNLVFDGGLPYEEDKWESFTLKRSCFKVLGKCARCQMICVNPHSSEQSKEPMLSLGKARGHSMPFGIHAALAVHGLSNEVVPLKEEHNSYLRVGMLAYVSIWQKET